MQDIGFTLNGRQVSLTTDPDRSLLSVLRHECGALGTRIGCSEGHCGACTVHVGGKAVQSCDTPLWSIKGAEITTIDGAAEGATIDRVRAAFLAEQAAQCAYCINGIVMTVAALLETSPRPDRAEMIHVLDERHICRCGAHPRILRALDRLLATDGGRVA